MHHFVEVGLAMAMDNWDHRVCKKDLLQDVVLKKYGTSALLNEDFYGDLP